MRGMPRSPAGGGGRPPTPPRQNQAARAQQQQRAAAEQQRRAAEQQRRVQEQRRRAADQQQRRGAEQQQRRAERQRQSDQQRRAAAAKAARQQHARKQQQYFREAHGARRAEEAEQFTAEVLDRVARLESILPDGLWRSAQIDLNALRRAPEAPAFDPGPLATPAPEPTWRDFAPPRLAGLAAGRAVKREREEAAREAYEHAYRQWEEAERERLHRLVEAEREYEVAVSAGRREADAYQDRLVRVAAGLRARDSQVVESFLRTVLRRVPLPPEFPRRAEVVHDPATEHVTVRMVLPGREVVPEASEYEYEEVPDEIRPVPRPVEESRALYRRVVDQTALLVVRDLFDAELHLAGVGLHGLVERSGNGRPEPVCLVRIDAAREVFTRIDLEGLAPEESLARLAAQVSPDPYAYEPIPVSAGVSAP
jgi:restriction system protein